ncbi:MAG TPA: tetratricopeptide repeat protein, partial [Candidatus Aerophobetes bacterium]|nr:tetratricopeptide repeat protein [Candidatus Aerophobetes bacterium]
MNKRRVGKEFLDDLTTLYNRRYFHQQIQENLKDSEKRKIPLSIAFIDLDHFKNVNDTYGHTRGDVVLKKFALFLKTQLRQDDTVFRYGGDEFICVLPNTNYQQAMGISQRIIERCRQKEFSQIRLTMSIGIASFPKDATDWKALVEIADRNLYSAKRQGRDRIGFFEKERRELIIPTKEMVGRGIELEKIREISKSIFNGKGGVVCISGEIGVGKTRLIQEVAKDAYFQDTLLLSSNLSATTKSIPYFPFREIIRALAYKECKECIKQIPEVYQMEITKIVPELSNRAKKMEKGIFMVDKYRLFEGIRRFLSIESSKRPLFILLDNIHWADDGSLELLYYLIRSLRESPVFFFLIFRIEESKEGNFQNILQLMSREGLYKEIKLAPLRIADVALMLSLILDAKPSTRLIDYIFNETGGNPFFIEELVKSLEENNALVWNKEEWVFDENRKVVIPYSLEGVVERKLSMIDSDAHRLIEYASVIGREFNFSLLREITGINEGQLFDLMDEILGMRLLKESGSEQYCFSEDLIREIVYQKISRGKLKRYHQIVGEKLLSLYKRHTNEVVEELANHFYLSGDRKKAVKYSIIAGDRARDAYANKDAIRFYTRAIESLDKTIKNRAVKEIECLKKRAEVLNLIGENKKAILDLKDAIKKSKLMGDKKEEADCLIVLSKVYQDTGQYDKASKISKKSLEIYKKLGDKRGKAEIFKRIANIHFYLGEYQKALEFYQRSLKIEEAIEDLLGQAENLNNVGVVYQTLGKFNQALEFFQQSLKISKAIADREIEAKSLNNIGIVHYNLGEYTDALRYYENSLKIFEEVGYRNAVAKSLSNIGNIHHSLGEYEKALEFYKNGLKIMEEVGDIQAEATNLFNTGSIYENLCNFDEALDLYQRSLKIVEEIGDRQMEVACLASIGNIHSEKNNYSLAETYVSKAFSLAQEINSKPLIVYVLLRIIAYNLVKGDLNEAKKRLKEVSSLTDKLDSSEYKADLLRLSGLLYTKEKKWEKAKSSFKKSILIFKDIKNEFELARVYYYQGLMFKELGDKTNASKNFIKARKIFEKLGAR